MERSPTSSFEPQDETVSCPQCGYELDLAPPSRISSELAPVEDGELTMTSPLQDESESQGATVDARHRETEYRRGLQLAARRSIMSRVANGRIIDSETIDAIVKKTGINRGALDLELARLYADGKLRFDGTSYMAADSDDLMSV